MRSSSTEHRPAHQVPPRSSGTTRDAPTRATWVRLAVALLVAAGGALTPVVGTTSALLTDADALTATVTTRTWVTPTATATATEEPTPSPEPTETAGAPGAALPTDARPTLRRAARDAAEPRPARAPTRADG